MAKRYSQLFKPEINSTQETNVEKKDEMTKVNLGEGPDGKTVLIRVYRKNETVKRQL
jgi:hypothetical protein